MRSDMWPDSLSWLIEPGILDLNMDIHDFLEILHEMLWNFTKPEFSKINKNLENQEHEKWTNMKSWMKT